MYQQQYPQYAADFTPVCRLYVIGGYGGGSDNDGLRSLNDVWVTSDGGKFVQAIHFALLNYQLTIPSSISGLGSSNSCSTMATSSLP
jgi:hypothetical protein